MYETPRSRDLQFQDLGNFLKTQQTPSPVVCLSPRKDLFVQQTAWLSGYKRQRLKSSLRHNGLNVFSSKRKVSRQRNKIKTKFLYSSTTVNEISVVFLQNVAYVVNYRLQSLMDSGKLHFFDKFEPHTILLCLVGDKGDGFSKLCFSIGNVSEPNSPMNLTLLYIYAGLKNYETMKNVFCATKLVEHLSFLRSVRLATNDGVIDCPVKWFLTGDMLFLCSITGHRSPSASFKCCICTEWNISSLLGTLPMQSIQQINSDTDDFLRGFASNSMKGYRYLTSHRI